MPILTFRGMRTFAAFLDSGGGRLKAAQAEAARITAARLLAVARAMYGQTPPLEALADSTQEERTALDYNANEPLLRDGHLLRDSVRAFSTPTLAVIESNEPIAAYHEFGYTTVPFGNPKAAPVAVPPRPVFRYTMMAVAPFVAKLNGETAKKVLGFE